MEERHQIGMPDEAPTADSHRAQKTGFHQLVELGPGNAAYCSGVLYAVRQTCVAWMLAVLVTVRFDVRGRDGERLMKIVGLVARSRQGNPFLKDASRLVWQSFDDSRTSCAVVSIPND